MKKQKSEIVTFKADEQLLEAMKGIPNRSEFIRSAVLDTLENTCPLCRGAGKLSPQQMEHWKRFAVDHSVKECGECHELYLVCTHNRTTAKHKK